MFPAWWVVQAHGRDARTEVGSKEGPGSGGRGPKQFVLDKTNCGDAESSRGDTETMAGYKGLLETEDLEVSLTQAVPGFGRGTPVSKENTHGTPWGHQAQGAVKWLSRNR